MNNSAFLGVVEKGSFLLLASDHEASGRYRLTNIAVNAAEPPEHNEIDLSKYEGNAIIVRGMENGAWIYSAIVIEEAGLILTAVVRQVFESPGDKKVALLKYPWI